MLPHVLEHSVNDNIQFRANTQLCISDKFKVENMLDSKGVKTVWSARKSLKTKYFKILPIPLLKI